MQNTYAMLFMISLLLLVTIKTEVSPQHVNIEAHHY